MKSTDQLKQKSPYRRMIRRVIVLFFFTLVVANSALAQTKVRQYGAYITNVQRGVRITVGNRTTGQITISGWDRDVIEARAVSPRGDEVVVAGEYAASGATSLFLKADYANLEQPATPAVPVDHVPIIDDQVVKIHLQVKVPRYTEIERIEVSRSDVEVSDVETQIVVSGKSSTIILKRVGAADVQTRDGNVQIDGVDGLATVVTASGAIHINKSKSFVRAVSIAGPIEVTCSSGRVDVSNTEAPITLANIDGDLDAVATNSNVKFAGNLREGARYFLKAMSGNVEMVLPANTRGFTSTLSSYRGQIENAFKLSNKQPISNSENRRVVGRFGNGKTQILLDSFEGLVRLTKVDEASIPPCK
jgi:hypothetical protein